ncbi:hypothetical protein TorRG33x02_114040 [Trema orientale]|uniref:Transmembrane protein n=1 Tax=Trema orientale TaxID=63057 RepID=A0A2P5F4U6_TREOI|nr:hypothetical protein TorRG33x02_114040 [Trema orientale]
MEEEASSSNNNSLLPLLLLPLLLLLLLLLQVLLLLLLRHERRHRKRLPDPHGGLEVNLLPRRVFDAHLRDRDPHEHLPALHPRHPLHPEPLHVRGHLQAVAHPSVGLLEEVLVRRLLLHPHESGLPDPPALFQILQRKNPPRKP